MKCEAIFSGTDGSMGFKKGHRYTINVVTDRGYIWVVYGLKAVPYETMRALLKNWNFTY